MTTETTFTAHNGETYHRISLKTVELDRIARDYDLKDSKGRAIGGRVVIREEVRAVEAGSNRLSKWLGTKISITPQALRNGVDYGACQSERYFETIEQARAAVEDYFAKAIKRAAKAAA